jgi:glucan phosphoethanolaminetransferase (alkaline phosphatase superfamily)
MYVLEGRFDSKQAKFFIKLFLCIIVPILVVIFWYTINGKPSTNMDETFGEMEVTNYNFFFFGNEQVESFVTYT